MLKWADECLIEVKGARFGKGRTVEVEGAVVVVEDADLRWS